jgi:hypothetical protein
MTDTIYYIIVAILAVYEALARIIPTEGNWTIVQNIVKLLDYLVKNRSTAGAEFTVTKLESEQNLEVQE